MKILLVFKDSNLAGDGEAIINVKLFKLLLVVTQNQVPIENKQCLLRTSWPLCIYHYENPVVFNGQVTEQHNYHNIVRKML